MYYTLIQLQKHFLHKIKEHSLKSAIVTKVTFSKKSLITKEVMENYCKTNAEVDGHKMNQSGRFVSKTKFQRLLRFKPGYKPNSVNDDLENFFESICTGDIRQQKIESYIFPKLNEEEKKLVDVKDHDFLATFSDYLMLDERMDIDKKDIDQSESKSMFVSSICSRETILIKSDDDAIGCFLCSFHSSFCSFCLQKNTCKNK